MYPLILLSAAMLATASPFLNERLAGGYPKLSVSKGFRLVANISNADQKRLPSVQGAYLSKAGNVAAAGNVALSLQAAKGDAFWQTGPSTIVADDVTVVTDAGRGSVVWLYSTRERVELLLHQPPTIDQKNRYC